MIKTILGCCFLSLMVCFPPESKAQLLDAETINTWKLAFPKIENDDEVANALKSEHTLFYTDEVMKRVYQFQGGLADANYNINAIKQFDTTGKQLPGNANKEFPWNKPGGLDLVKNLVTLRFVYLPPSANGVKWPIVWYQNQIEGDSVIEWNFPAGAIVGEFLAYYPPNGQYSYIFEVRVRKRYIEKWETDVFKPFQTVDDLSSRLRDYGRDDLADKLVKLPTLVNYNLKDKQTRTRLFDVTLPLDYLPEFNDPKLVHELLTTTPFYSSTGMPWRWNNEGKTISNAPFTKEEYSIIPANYLGGMIALTNESCTRCHMTTLVHSGVFSPNRGNGREWYGRERGSDGIFSFHPFESNAVAFGGVTRPVINTRLVNTGFVANFDPKVHPKNVYSVIPDYNPRIFNAGFNDGGVVFAR